MTAFPLRRLRFVCEEPLKYGANAAAQFDDPAWPRFVRITDITESGQLKDGTFRSLPPEVAEDYLLEEGDILLARSGSIGRSFIYKPEWGQACFAGYLVRARLSEEFDPRFVYWALNSLNYWSWIESIAIRSTIQNVSAERYADYAVPAPRFDTQRRIARFLDQKTARIDGLIEKKRELLDRLAEKRQALITRAVTKGLNPDVPMKPSGIDWLGDIPTHWKELPLNRIIRMRSGDYIAASDIDTEGRYLVFGGNGVRGFADAFNTVGPIILVGRQGAHCGNVQVARGNVWVSEHALKCLAEKKFDVRWLAYMLESMNLNQYSVSAAQPGLSVDNLNHLRTAFPPPDEQRNIADHLEAHCCYCEAIAHKARKSLSLLEEYRSALITAAVKGLLAELR